jgi:pimeloyl-ACP methyl ester carboxylesterase
MIMTRQFRATDGLTLNASDYGGEGKRPLLFVHGGSAHAHWWDFVAPAFVDRFHVLALDQRGHGDSPRTAQWSYGTRQYVADLEAIIAHWGLPAPVLVGHSMGGHTVLNYAGDHSEQLKAMVVIDSPAGYPAEALEALREVAQRPSRPYPTLEEAIAKFRTNPPQNNAKPEILQYVARHSFRQDESGGWVHKMDRRTFIREPISASKILGQIRCPALYIRAALSVIRREVGEKIAAGIAGCGFVTIPDSYHHIMIDNPEGLIAALDEFLNALQ